MKKAICLILCLCLIFALTGCKKTTDTNSGSSGDILPSADTNLKTISLLYSYSDVFNPYTAKTAANRQLSTLLYDSLVKTDNNFNAQYVLAQSVENVDKVCTVKLKNATFTDGSTVSADDVVYSYNLAKQSVLYAHNFYEVTSVSAVDAKTVVFNLSQYDKYFENLLDFPIVKSGTSDLTDADGKEIAPIGCGRYYISTEGPILELNTNYYGKLGNIGRINLIDSPDSVSTSHYVEIGATQLYYTDNSNIVRMSGKKTEVNLNRFVYIGINSNYAPLGNKEIRYAISSALNRDAICQSAYYNNAIAAEGFFNPLFEPTKALQTIESKPNSKITVENLSKIGYNNTNDDGYSVNASGNYPTFTLLVNSENYSRVAAAKMIAEQCKTVGIDIKVIECTYEQYTASLSSGGFQLYLGEVQVLNNMDFSQLVTVGGSAAYGVANSEPQNDVADEVIDDNAVNMLQQNSCQQILSAYHKGECGISDVAGTLLTEMPQIPVCYLNGVLFYDSSIRGGVQASNSDIYLSIENYEF